MDVANEIRALKERIGRLEGRVVSAGAKGPNHELLDGSYHPDTLNEDPVAGDIIIGNATPKWARLAKDANDKILKLVAGLPAWAVEAGAAPIGLKVFDSDFDSLANGNINGQGTYTYAGTWVNISGAGCTAEIMADPGGGKMLRLHDASAINFAKAYIDLDAGYEILTGVVEWKMKVAVQAANSRGYFFIVDSGAAGNQGGYFRGDAADIYYRGAAGATAKLCDAAIDTWYVVKMYFCRLGNYAVWWVDGVFEQPKIIINAGNKFDRLVLETRDTYDGQDFDIKYVNVWLLHYVT